MSVFEKLQKLPEPRKKTIFWLLIIIFGISLFIFYIKSLKERLSSIKPEGLQRQFQIEKFQEELKNMPKFEMPDFNTLNMSEEDLKKLEELGKILEENE